MINLILLLFISLVSYFIQHGLSKAVYLMRSLITSSPMMDEVSKEVRRKKDKEEFAIANVGRTSRSRLATTTTTRFLRN